MQYSQSQPSKHLKSNHNDQSYFYLKIETEGGNTQIVQKDFVPMLNYSYRMVHQVQGESRFHQGDQPYVDSTYQIDTHKEFPYEEIIVKRLSNMYGVTNLPQFFDLENNPTTVEDGETVPYCIQQLGLFDTLYYKKFFISQNFQESGKYQITAYIQGKYQVITIDDRVPFYRQTLEPIWDLCFSRPWQMLLIKAWAKLKGGYHKINKENGRPFEFVEAFSISSWKYCNIQKQAGRFLKHYSESSRFRSGKIILRAKQDDEDKLIEMNGIVPNAACYQLLALFEEMDDLSKQKRYVLAIRGTDQAKFEGEINFYRLNSQKFFIQGMNLQHDFFMTDGQFLQIFSTAYITSNRSQSYYSGYKIIDIPSQCNKSFHYQFYLEKEGFLDFSIKQLQSNLVTTATHTQQNTIENNHVNASASSRYLRNKYMLVRDNQIDPLNPSRLQTSLVGSQAIYYRMPRFSTYEIQYMKGNSSGDAHFVRLDPGRYILRFKSENIDKQAKYVLNWICSKKIEFLPAKLSDPQKKELLHDSMVSIMHKFPYFSFDKNAKTEMITFANAFDELGYGFVAVKSAIECTRSIVLQVNPKVVREQGYLLKGKYKQAGMTNKKFCIKIEKGEYAVVVFKLNSNMDGYKWPSEAFNIFKKENPVKQNIQQPPQQIPQRRRFEQSKVVVDIPPSSVNPSNPSAVIPSNPSAVNQINPSAVVPSNPSAVNPTNPSAVIPSNPSKIQEMRP